MTKYRIVPKRDFGGQPFLINGRSVLRGFLVCYNTGPFKGCNAMPGATWSETIRGALQMIRVFEKVGGEPLKRVGDRFWPLLHRINGTTQRHREETARMMRALGLVKVKRNGEFFLVPKQETQS